MRSSNLSRAESSYESENPVDLIKAKQEVLDFFSAIWLKTNKKIGSEEVQYLQNIFSELISLHLSRVQTKEERIRLLQLFLSFARGMDREFINTEEEDQRDVFDNLKVAIEKDNQTLFYSQTLALRAVEEQKKGSWSEFLAKLENISNDEYPKNVANLERVLARDVCTMNEGTRSYLLTQFVEIARNESESEEVQPYAKEYMFFLFDSIADLRSRLRHDPESIQDIVSEWLSERELVFRKWLVRVRNGLEEKLIQIERDEVSLREEKASSLRNQIYETFSGILKNHFRKSVVQAALGEIMFTTTVQLAKIGPHMEEDYALTCSTTANALGLALNRYPLGKSKILANELRRFRGIREGIIDALEEGASKEQLKGGSLTTSAASVDVPTPLQVRRPAVQDERSRQIPLHGGLAEAE